MFGENFPPFTKVERNLKFFGELFASALFAISTCCTPVGQIFCTFLLVAMTFQGIELRQLQKALNIEPLLAELENTFKDPIAPSLSRFAVMLLPW